MTSTLPTVDAVDRKSPREHAGFVLAVAGAIFACAAVAAGIAAAEQVSGTKQSFTSDAWGTAAVVLLAVGALLVIAAIVAYALGRQPDTLAHPESPATVVAVKEPEVRTATQVMPGAATHPEREFADAGPAQILRVFKGRTAIQARMLVEQYIGKWLRLSGTLDNVGEWDRNLKFAGVTLNEFDHRHDSFVLLGFTDEKVVNSRLALLNRGDKMTVVGRIRDIKGMYVDLTDCEIESVETQ